MHSSVNRWEAEHDIASLWGGDKYGQLLSVPFLRWDGVVQEDPRVSCPVMTPAVRASYDAEMQRTGGNFGSKKEILAMKKAQGRHSSRRHKKRRGVT